MDLAPWIPIGLIGLAVIWFFLRWAARVTAPKEMQGRDFLLAEVFSWPDAWDFPDDLLARKFPKPEGPG